MTIVINFRIIFQYQFDYLIPLNSDKNFRINDLNIKMIESIKSYVLFFEFLENRKFVS